MTTKTTTATRQTRFVGMCFDSNNEARWQVIGSSTDDAKAKAQNQYDAERAAHGADRIDLEWESESFRGLTIWRAVNIDLDLNIIPTN